MWTWSLRACAQQAPERGAPALTSGGQCVSLHHRVHGHVLLVDDDGLLRGAVRLQIKQAGWICHQADSYASTLEVIRNEPRIQAAVVDPCARPGPGSRKNSGSAPSAAHAMRACWMSLPPPSCARTSAGRNPIRRPPKNEGLSSLLPGFSQPACISSGKCSRSRVSRIFCSSTFCRNGLGRNCMPLTSTPWVSMTSEV